MAIRTRSLSGPRLTLIQNLIVCGCVRSSSATSVDTNSPSTSGVSAAVTRIPSEVSSRPTQDMREPSPESGLTLKNSPGW